MDNQELRKLLDELNDEVKASGSVDEKGAELLRGLDEEIHKLLERSGENELPPNIPLLENSLDYFEVTHPELTLLISRLLDFLSNTGI
jgi:hypothetical protein